MESQKVKPPHALIYHLKKSGLPVPESLLLLRREYDRKYKKLSRAGNVRVRKKKFMITNGISFSYMVTPVPLWWDVC